MYIEHLTAIFIIMIVISNIGAILFGEFDDKMEKKHERKFIISGIIFSISIIIAAILTSTKESIRNECDILQKKEVKSEEVYEVYIKDRILYINDKSRNMEDIEIIYYDENEAKFAKINTYYDLGNKFIKSYDYNYILYIPKDYKLPKDTFEQVDSINSKELVDKISRKYIYKKL